MSHRDRERDDYRRGRDRRGPPPRDRSRDRGDRYKDPPPRDRDRREARGGRDPGRSRRNSRSSSPPRRDGDRVQDRDHRERDDKRRSRSRSKDRYRRDDRRPDRPDDRKHDRRDNRRDDMRDGRRDDRRERERDGTKRVIKDDAVKPHIGNGPDGPREPVDMQVDSKPVDDYDPTEEDISTMMGFGGFSTTKGTHVEGNQVGGSKVNKQRTWRQYMNRRGGFNRPLDKVK